MELACERKGAGLVSHSGIPSVGEGEQLEWSVMLAIPAREDSCGDGGGCFR